SSSGSGIGPFSSRAWLSQIGLEGQGLLCSPLPSSYFHCWERPPCSPELSSCSQCLEDLHCCLECLRWSLCRSCRRLAWYQPPFRNSSQHRLLAQQQSQHWGETERLVHVSPLRYHSPPSPPGEPGRARWRLYRGYWPSP